MLATIAFLVNVFVVDDTGDEIVFRSLGEVPALAVAIFAVASGALLWRRRRPLTVLAVTLAASGLAIAPGHGGAAAVILAVCAVGRYADEARSSYVGLVGALVITGVDALVAPSRCLPSASGCSWCSSSGTSAGGCATGKSGWRRSSGNRRPKPAAC